MKKRYFEFFFVVFCLLQVAFANAQMASLSGTVNTLNGEALSFANIAIEGTALGATTDTLGNFEIKNIPVGTHKILAMFLGYETTQKKIKLTAGENANIIFTLVEAETTMDEIVVTGTLKEVSRLESPVPVEVNTPTFFKKNPTPNIYEALQNVNGVRPQLNC
ncbi:MAG: carboxypeptidase-like regulatory domain-containing protein, partial [Saprospiraceae bacterium]